MLLSGWLPALAALAAPKPPAQAMSETVETRTIDRITAVSVEGKRTITVEIHRQGPTPIWWPEAILDRGDSVVVSIVEDSNPDSRWEIVAIPPLVLAPREDVYVVSIQAIHADSVVFLKCDQMYGVYCTSIKVFFDANVKKVLGRVETEPLGESKLVAVNGSVYSVTERQRFSANRAEAIVARYSPGKPALVSGAERNAAIASAPPSPSRSPYPYLNKSPILKDGLLDASVTPLTRPSCFHQASSSPPLWIYIFDLNNEDQRGIAVQEGDSYRAYPFPRTTSEELAHHRPELVAQYPFLLEKNGRSRILEWIDSSAMRANRLWLGRGLYDGEGSTGVGAFGYFDLDRRTYTMTTIPEIADWSTSAIYVEQGLIWMGLAHHTEGASSSGGLLRYDRDTGETHTYPIEHVITDILGRNGLIYLGVERGRVFMLKDDSVFASYSVEPSLNGGHEIRSLSIEHLQ